MVSGQKVDRTEVAGLDGRDLERNVARAVVGLVQDHQDTIQRHRRLVIIVYVDRKTGEVKASFVVAGRE